MITWYRMTDRLRGSGLIAAAAVTIFGSAGLSNEAAAKIPGGTHCYFGICHRVKTLPETERLVGSRNVVKASFYDDCKVDRFNPCTLTSSGEVFKPWKADNAASPIYPDGTKLLVWNAKTKLAAVVRVNSAGPYHSNRTLDVSRATAEKLGFRNSGVASLHVQVLSAPTQKETVYKKHREYPAVPGPIGKFVSFDLAAAETVKLIGGNQAATQVAANPPSPRLKFSKRPINNGKVLKAAGTPATMITLASAVGTPGQIPALSAGAIMMSAIPYRLLPDGVVTDVKRPASVTVAQKKIAAKQ